MKGSVVTIFFFILIAIIIAFTLGSKIKSSSRGPFHPTECCFSYAVHTIQRERITDYYVTSSQCSQPGVVFITRKGHSICANPRDDWVQDYIKDLD